MRNDIPRIFAAAAVAALICTSANAQPVKLPIAEGIWVKTDTQCKTAYMAYVHTNGRFGNFYFYGPKQGMGPANETEVISHVGKGKGGFVVVNDGPIEVSTGPKGQAVVRAVSLSEGVQWTETIRLCPAATLSPKMRAGLVREHLVSTPAR